MLTWPASGFSQFWLAQSLAGPALALWNVPDGVFAGNSSLYFFALSTSHALGWLSLVAASVVLRGAWREHPTYPIRRSGTAEPPRVLLPAKWRVADPLGWLARHRLGGQAPAWVLVAVTMLVVGLLNYAAESGQASGIAVMFAAYALHGSFKVWIGWVASRAFAVERDNGALEMLLITPLGEAAIWQAWLKGLRQRFLVPALSLVAFDLALAWRSATLDNGSGNLSVFFLTLLAAPVFLLDCYTLTWTGLWSGLIARNPTRGCVRTLLGPLIVPGLAFLSIAFASAVAGLLNAGALIILVLCWFVVSFLLDLIYGVLAMVRLSHDCREAVVMRWQ
jgi:hypothetical protein